MIEYIFEVSIFSSEVLPLRKLLANATSYVISNTRQV